MSWPAWVLERGASPWFWIVIAVQGHLFTFYYSRIILHQTNPRSELLYGAPYVLLQAAAFAVFLHGWDFSGGILGLGPTYIALWVFLCLGASAGLLLRHLGWMVGVRRKVRFRPLRTRILSQGYQPPLQALQKLGLRNQLYDLQVRELELELPNWPKEWSGLTVVHLTDLHHGRYIHDGYLAGVRAETLRLKPDLVVLTGDFVSTPGDFPKAFDWLKGLRARMGVFAVLGNHEGWIDAPRAEKSLRKAGIRVLKNDGVRFQRGRSSLALMGAEDLWTGERGLERLRNLRADAKILLAHHPDHFFLARQLGAQLQLSGHCHGGQVCLPGGSAVVAPSRFGTRYASGFFREGPSIMFVNRGVGAYPPIRLFCPPEMVKLTLRPETA